MLERLALVEREFDRGEGAAPAPRGYGGGGAAAGPREITLMVVRACLSVVGFQIHDLQCVYTQMPG